MQGVTWVWKVKVPIQKENEAPFGPETMKMGGSIPSPSNSGSGRASGFSQRFYYPTAGRRSGICVYVCVYVCVCIGVCMCVRNNFATATGSVLSKHSCCKLISADRSVDSRCQQIFHFFIPKTGVRYPSQKVGYRYPSYPRKLRQWDGIRSDLQVMDERTFGSYRQTLSLNQQ